MYDWVQGIQSLLCENGFGEIWINPTSVNKDTFHKFFRQRLNDQHVQNWNAKLQESNRFKILTIESFDNKINISV